jgi:hypothetical protein
VWSATATTVSGLRCGRSDAASGPGKGRERQTPGVGLCRRVTLKEGVQRAVEKVCPALELRLGLGTPEMVPLEDGIGIPVAVDVWSSPRAGARLSGGSGGRISFFGDYSRLFVSTL